MSSLEKIAACILFWLIFTLAFININFFLGFKINIWTLIVSYFLFILLLTLWVILFFKRIPGVYFFLVIILPYLFIVSANSFGRTFDGSHDGQDYHSGAIIELAHGWNPIKQAELPIKLPDANTYVMGYPKSLWVLQTGIYKITGKLNSGVVTNVIAIIFSSVFIYHLLKRLKLNGYWPLLITGIFVFEPTYIQQFYTFMADGFGYQISLVAIASLISLFIVKDNTLYIATFLSSCILLLGIKFSNIPLVGLMGLIFMYFVIKNIRIYKYFPIYILFLILSLVILFVPYGTNYIYYGSPVYPSNQDYAYNDLYVQNIPKNLKNENRFSLLMHGIYSQAQRAGPANGPDNIAKIKLPFTTSLEELFITNNYNGRVGSMGVFFSGIFSIGIVLYLVLCLIFYKVFNHKIYFLVLSLIIFLIPITSLVIPSSNVLRYNPLIYIIPACVLVSLILSKAYQQVKLIRILCVVFASLFVVNMALKFIPTVNARNQELKSQNFLLTSMKESNKTYSVKTISFYSSYVRLQEYGVKFKVVDRLPCKKPRNMWIMFNTYFCP